jgi:hypothetical protein
MSIFLCIYDKNEKETHIRWDEHTSLESAKKELENVTNMALKIYYETGDKNNMPNTCYVYEAEKPHYGNKEEDVDEQKILNILKRDFGPINK